MAISKTDIKEEWYRKFDKSLRKHLRYYKEAARILGVDRRLIEIHDMSKTSEAEYDAYVRRFGGGIKIKDEWNEAWANHVRLNPHHWEYWVIPGGREEENTPVPMPRMYALEMVADWMGSSKAYTDSYDMTDWLKKNLPRIHLHPDTWDYVLEVLSTPLTDRIPTYDMVDLVAWERGVF